MTNSCFKQIWNDDPQLLDVFHHQWADGQLLEICGESPLNGPTDDFIFWMCKSCPFGVHKASGSISKSAISQSYLNFFGQESPSYWLCWTTLFGLSFRIQKSLNRRFGLLDARFMDPVFTPWMSSTSNPSPISMARWVGPWCATRRAWTAICSSATHGLKESSNFWGKCCTAGHEVRDYWRIRMWFVGAWRISNWNIKGMRIEPWKIWDGMILEITFRTCLEDLDDSWHEPEYSFRIDDLTDLGCLTVGTPFHHILSHA